MGTRIGIGVNNSTTIGGSGLNINLGRINTGSSSSGGSSSSHHHSDADVLEAVANHPELLNRPIVVTPWGARLCRPPEMVLELLSAA